MVFCVQHAGLVGSGRSGVALAAVPPLSHQGQCWTLALIVALFAFLLLPCAVHLGLVDLQASQVVSRLDTKKGYCCESIAHVLYQEIHTFGRGFCSLVPDESCSSGPLTAPVAISPCHPLSPQLSPHYLRWSSSLSSSHWPGQTIDR